MERMAKINGVIPDRSLVTVDQRAIHLDRGEVTFSIEAASGNMAKMMYEAEEDAVGNGGGAVQGYLATAAVGPERRPVFGADSHETPSLWAPTPHSPTPEGSIASGARRARDW
jgi:hypothetical protein